MILVILSVSMLAVVLVVVIASWILDEVRFRRNNIFKNPRIAIADGKLYVAPGVPDSEVQEFVEWTERRTREAIARREVSG